jgi:drug/metabolite transporter (DMT)-like permease
MLTLFAVIMMLTGPGWQPMDTKSTILVLSATATVTIALVTITLALRSGEISAVAPFRYTRIVFAMVLAMIFFGERPDAMTWLGTGIVVGSGIYAFWRERRVQAQIPA